MALSMARQQDTRASRDRLDVGWGLLKIVEEPDRDRIEVLWGMLSLSVPRHRSAQGSDDNESAAATPTDPFQAAIRRTDERMANLQACFITAMLALAFYALASMSVKENWAAFWGVGSFVVGAVSAGLLLSVFGEGFRRRWLTRELSEADAQREARRVVASEHTEAIQELTASIAHEIRNPITAAKSLVQQMGEDPASLENVEFASVALGELERVERSVSHLLRFAKNEQIEMHDMRLSDTVESAVAALRDRAALADVDLEPDVGAVGEISGDAEKLRRVFLNLVGNAIDAVSQANEPASTPTPVRKGWVRIEVGENLAGTEVWARVRDNGPGIETGLLPKIFNPFHTSKETGTGLGLPICKKIVEGHAGTIDVSSTPGEGAEFVVTFPKRAGLVVA